ncbi:metal ABC transporter substrate-binding protein [Aquipuribacter sp. MA13-6]|uniref:metal ABC transporter substrate-binding protein n=1 Tax=unclassified Aquipuribacter TaxID=2635084 RepID=UPI003EEFB26C
MTAPRYTLFASAVAATLVLAACGGGEATDDTTTVAPAAAPAAASTDPSEAADPEASVEAAAPSLAVVASFYPLQFLTERVAGDRAEVTGLTPPGAEAHDLELTPQSLAGLTESDLVVTLAGFQPPVDEALAGMTVPVADLAPVADRELAQGEDDGHGHGDEHSDEEGEHSEEEGGDTDPHFWTDPTHMAEAAQVVADALAEADPEGAETYAANAQALVAELTELDTEAEAAFASCEVDTLVTAHNAFGYFGDRYGFEIRAINGISPDQEPDARALAEISDYVAENGISTVYTETLLSSAVADTVASEAGVQTMVLDPLEGLTDESPGADYLEVMRANIDAVTTGQVCT